MSWWEDLWRTEASIFLNGFLDADQCEESIRIPRVAIETDAAYLTATLRRIRIVNARIATKHFYAGTNSELKLWHESGHYADFLKVIAPPDLKDVPTERLDRSIVTDQVLMGPTPYRGGELALNLALLALEASDLAGPFLDILSEVATASGVSFVNAAKPFFGPLQRGIDLLFSVAGKKGLELFLVTNIKPVQTGVYVVLRVDRGIIKLTDLRLDKDYVLTDANDHEVRDYPYFVVTIEASAEKHDWKAIPDLKSAHDAYLETLKAGNPQAITEAMEAFRRTALLSPDLLTTHAQKLVQKAKEKYEELYGAGPVVTGRAKKKMLLPELDDYDPFGS